VQHTGAEVEIATTSRLGTSMTWTTLLSGGEVHPDLPPVGSGDGEDRLAVDGNPPDLLASSPRSTTSSSCRPIAGRKTRSPATPSP
jgi:hypothetical protein